MIAYREKWLTHLNGMGNNRLAKPILELRYKSNINDNYGVITGLSPACGGQEDKGADTLR
jgi:hypothetical protein